MAISNSASPEIIWRLGGPEEDHQLDHCCWTGREGKREEEERLPLLPQQETLPYCYYWLV